MGTNNLNNAVGRIFVIDHMCVLPFGHNLNALVHFKQALEGSFSESFALASRDLPDEAEQAVQVRRELMYPYIGLVPVAKKSKARDASTSIFNQLRPLAWRAVFTGSAMLIGYDYMRAALARDWRKVFRRYGIGQTDSLFFPSAEFYGCISLLDVLKRMSPSERPAVHFRMIGVMENANYHLDSGRPRFFKAVKEARELGIRISLSAETPVYCELISRLTGLTVEFLPYPLTNSFSEVSWASVKTISSPGQGRADKGFMRLHEIFKRIQQKEGDSSFIFDVQDMRNSDRYFRRRYQSILSHTPNLRLRSARLMQTEIDKMYRDADIFILPYDAQTYAYRGSAVFQEGIAVGRPVVASNGVGFGDLVERYGNGLQATTDAEFSERIVELASWSKKDVTDRMVEARKRYEDDFTQGLNAVIGSMKR